MVRSGSRRLRNGKTNRASQNTCPRYASPTSPRAGTPASMSATCSEMFASRWKMCRRSSVEADAVAVLELERAEVPELVPAQDVLTKQLVEPGAARRPPRAAFGAGSETAGSRDVWSATTFSAVIASPWVTSASISRPIQAGSSSPQLGTGAISPSRRSRVCAASATRMCDWLVSTSSRIVSGSRTCVVTGTRCGWRGRGSGRRRRWTPGRRARSGRSPCPTS